MPPRTDDGRVMAFAQIDYSQYDIWDIFGIGVRPEKQFFVGKTTKYPKFHQLNLSAQAQKWDISD